MRNHYEGTVLDPRLDVGAGDSGSPFRVRPIVWKHDNNTYVNERSVGTQQAGWNFVAQLRGWLPAPIGGIIWFGVDDATFSVHAPFHGSTTTVPKCFADGTGDALTWSGESGFWAFNSVANFIYPRWFIASEVIAKAAKTEAEMAESLQKEEEVALALFKESPDRAAEYLTIVDGERATKIVKDEFSLFGQLMVTYRDGFHISSAGPNAPNHGGAQGGVVAAVQEVGYSDSWYARIVADTGDHYKMTDPHTHPDLLSSKLRALNKGSAGVWIPSSATMSEGTVIV